MKEFIINFPKKITTNYLYTTFSEKLEYFLYSDSEFLTFNFNKTTFIEPTSLPLLLSLGLQLFNNYNVIANLVFGNNVRIINFLFYSGFFTNSSRFYLINPECLGGINDPKIKKLSPKYIIGNFKSELIYPFLGDSDRERAFRIMVFNSVMDKFERKYFFSEIVKELFTIEEQNEELLKKQFNYVVAYLCEIITNAIIHSESDSYIYGQTTNADYSTTKRKTSFSIADAGIGFFKSLENKNWPIIYPKSQVYEMNNTHYNDLISILNALEYSYQFKGIRSNLWEVFNFYINNNGIIKIHHNQTQIIFSNHLCKNCQTLGVDNCFKCFSQHNESINWNFNKFTFPIDGVHIELEIEREITRGKNDFFIT